MTGTWISTSSPRRAARPCGSPITDSPTASSTGTPTARSSSSPRRGERQAAIQPVLSPSPRRAASRPSFPFPTARCAGLSAGREEDRLYARRPRRSGPGSATAAAGPPTSGCSTSRTLASEQHRRERRRRDEFPMWHAGTLYFLSDRGQENRANIWAYDLAAKTARQVTRFTDFDIHFPALGPSDIVFEAGGKLYLLGLADEKLREVPVRVITDEITLRPEDGERGRAPASGSLRPTASGPLVQARGDVFSVPAENGPVFNLTRTPGTAERYPACRRTASRSPTGATRPANTSSSSRDLAEARRGEGRHVLRPGLPLPDLLVAGREEDRLRRSDDEHQRLRRRDRGHGKADRVRRALSRGRPGELPRILVAGQPLARVPQGPRGRGSAIFLYDDRRGQGPPGHVGLLRRQRARRSIRTASTSTS